MWAAQPTFRITCLLAWRFKSSQSIIDSADGYKSAAGDIFFMSCLQPCRASWRTWDDRGRPSSSATSLYPERAVNLDLLAARLCNWSRSLHRFVGVSDRLQLFVKEQERNKQLCSSAPQTSDTQPRTPSTSASAAKQNTKTAAKKKQKSDGRKRSKSGKEAGRVVGDRKVAAAEGDLNEKAGNGSQTLGTEEKTADGGIVDPAQCEFLFFIARHCFLSLRHWRSFHTRKKVVQREHASDSRANLFYTHRARLEYASKIVSVNEGRGFFLWCRRKTAFRS